MARKKTSSPETEPAAPVERTIAFKAFDANFQCRGYQYEVGKTYRHEGEVVICQSGFHAVENYMDVWTYYPLHGSRYAEVELVGPVVRHDEDSKIAGAEIVIKAELKLPEFIKRATTRLVEWITSKADSNIATGDSGHAAATGYNSVAVSLGYAGTAMAGPQGAIMLACYDDDGNLLAVAASKVGENGVEPNVAYRLTADGEFVKVEAAS